MKIPFTKMHGCGNDFVIIDGRQEARQLSEEQKILIADRHRGIGCDQLIILEESEKADVFMRIFNPDASEAQACGNATRCVAALEATGDSITIETVERLLPCSILENGEVSVNMGQAISCEKIDLGDEYKTLGQAMSVNVGNPHCVFVTDDAEAVDLQKWGSQVENHAAFPERCNVEFVSPIDNRDFRVRVWERGAGITLACGSGAVAVTRVIFQENVITGQFVELHMDGGILRMAIKGDDNIIMQGEVAHVFTGEIEI